MTGKQFLVIPRVGRRKKRKKERRKKCFAGLKNV